jgi:hypothetical protein
MGLQTVAVPTAPDSKLAASSGSPPAAAQSYLNVEAKHKSAQPNILSPEPSPPNLLDEGAVKFNSMIRSA